MVTVEFECDVCKAKKPKVSGPSLRCVYVDGTSTLMVQGAPASEPRYLEACTRCVSAVLAYIGKIHAEPASAPTPPKPRIVKPPREKP